MERGKRRFPIERILLNQDLHRQAINHLTTNRYTLEILMFLKTDVVHSSAIHCALPRSYYSGTQKYVDILGNNSLPFFVGGI